MSKILIAEDDTGLRTFFTEVLESAHEIVAVADGFDAIEALKGETFDLVVTDIRMPHVDGFGVLEHAREHAPDTPVLVLTAFGDVTTAVKAMKLGAADFLEKPLPSPKTLREAVEKYAVERSSKHPPLELGDCYLSFFSDSMTSVAKMVDRILGRPSHTLLFGEPGVGKGTLAVALGKHAGEEVTVVDAGAQRERLETALQEAHGVLVVRNIEALEAAHQTALLRVIQEQRARVHATSASTLEQLIERVNAGSFSIELLRALGVYVVTLPPLRARKADIVPLAEALLRKTGQDVTLTEEARKALFASHWPGNITSLKSMLRIALDVADDGSIGLGELPSLAQDEEEVDLTIAAAERRAIVTALELHGGNRELAAATLDISVRSLYYKLKQMSD